MSRIWGREEMADVATRLSGWGGFGEVCGRGGFRPLYSENEPVACSGVDGLSRSGVRDDPLEALRNEAFAQGFDEGFTAALGEQAEAVAARHRLAEALEHVSPVEPGTLSAMISVAVLRLVEQIAGEVPVDADLLRTRCQAVAACVDTDDGQTALRIHPDDMALLEGTELAVQLVADPALKPGCVRLHTADGWVEDGPDVRLARLKALLDNMEGRV